MVLRRDIYTDIYIYIKVYQGSFDHVKVRPTPVLELHNVWRQIHMFLDILEFRIENKKKYLEKTDSGSDF